MMAMEQTQKEIDFELEPRCVLFLVYFLYGIVLYSPAVRCLFFSVCRRGIEKQPRHTWEYKNIVPWITPRAVPSG